MLELITLIKANHFGGISHSCFYDLVLSQYINMLVPNESEEIIALLCAIKYGVFLPHCDANHLGEEVKPCVYVLACVCVY